MKALLLIFVGGGAGSVLRYVISKAVTLDIGIGGFPAGTLLVNVLGSFIIGVFMGLSLRENASVSENTMLLITTGFCGGFTTFSTFALENQQLLKNGDWPALLTYVLASLMLGVLAVFAGIAFSR
ncbi:MAG: fluoride efflux transporter CrcB [Leeuwenhoekiella sp.]